MEKKTYYSLLFGFVVLLFMALGFGYVLGKEQTKNRNYQEKEYLDTIKENIENISKSGYLESMFHDDDCNYQGNYEKGIILNNLTDEEKLAIMAHYAQNLNLFVSPDIKEEEAIDYCGNQVCAGLTQGNLKTIMANYNFNLDIDNLMIKKDNLYYFKDLQEDCSNIQNIEHNFSYPHYQNNNIVLEDNVTIYLDKGIIKEKREFNFKEKGNNYYLYSVINTKINN